MTKGKDDIKGEFSNPGGGAALGVRVITRAAATELAGKTDEGVLKVRVVATPASSPEANQELIQFLAAQLGVATNQISIVAGQDSSDKMLVIEGKDITAEMVENRLFPAS
jgi:uncharacterized protein YggU (UPF0235/DUF167 family)